MAEVFGNSFDIVSVFKADCGERMPQIMEPDVRHSDRCDPRFESVIHGTGADMIPQFRTCGGRGK